MILFTGRGGHYDFETALKIELCSKDPEAIADLFRKSREETYKLMLENEKLKRLWLVKLYLKFFKI